MRLLFIVVCACLAAVMLITPAMAQLGHLTLKVDRTSIYEGEPVYFSGKYTNPIKGGPSENVLLVLWREGDPLAYHATELEASTYTTKNGYFSFIFYPDVTDEYFVSISRYQYKADTSAGKIGLDSSNRVKISVHPQDRQGNLQARFIYSPANPNSASCVSFSSAVTGGTPPYTYQWNFGDGKTSTEQNPRTFWSAKDYTVTLTVKDSTGKTGTASQKIHVDQALPTGWGSWYSPLQASANFSTGPLTDPAAGFPVEFHPELRFKISREVAEDPCHKNVYTCTRTYLWDFGDGTPSSASENPSHTFAEPGTYTVTMTVKDDYPERCGNTRCYIWTDETAVVTREITVVEPGEGEIGGTIWSDTNRNGIRDPGEQGIPDVGVMLKSHSPNPGPSPTTRTGADGRYSFTGVTAPGKYSLLFEEPDGQQYTSTDVGSDDTIDSDVMQTIARTNTFILKPGESQTSWDGGTVARPGAGQEDAQRTSFFIRANETGNSSIGGIVWEDMNENGIQDADEPALQDSNVSISLWRTGEGKLDETTLSNGTYQFTSLPPGEYRVQYGSPGSYIFTSQDQVTDDTIDSDAQTVGNYTGYTDAITLGENESQLAWDAGVIPTFRVVEHTPLTEENLTGNGTIGDFVWNDVNANGIQDTGEPGIPGVHVELVRMLSKFEFQRANATTSADGKYLFEGLENGTYFVQFTLPQGTNVTQLNAGSDDALDSDIYPLSGTTVWTTPAIVLGDNDSRLDWDAGMVGAVPANNTTGGNITGGEAIAGEEWELFNLINAYRAENGLEPLALSADLTEAAVPWSRQMARENRLYHDPNWVQRVQGTGYPQAALGENLYMGTGDRGTAENAFEAWKNSAQHNANMLDGDYVMVGIGRDGGYWTAVFGGVVHGDTLQGPQNQTATNATGSGTIGGVIWEDWNENGIRDPGELAAQDPRLNVTIQMINGQWIDGKRHSNGTYEFTNLAPGQYRVEFIIGDLYTFTSQDQGTDDTVDSDAQQTGNYTGFTGTITLGEGERQMHWDAGLIPGIRAVEHTPLTEENLTGNGTIGDYVWNDMNTNGIQDTGEPGIPGVHVELVRMLSKFEFQRANATTSADGKYLFEGLENGTYFVQFTLPPGANVTQLNAGSDDALDSDIYPLSGTTVWTTPAIVLGDNESRLDWDAGLVGAVSANNTIGRVAAGEEEWRLFNLINAYRAENGLEPLTLSADLTEAAVPWSRQMARENRLYHDPNWVQRVQGTGYPQAALGENLYMGTGDRGTAENAFEAWKNSAQHNANMLDGDYVMVGIGRDGGYWTAVFGGVMHGDTLREPGAGPALNATGNSSIGDLVWNDTDGNGLQDEGEEGIPNAAVELYYANETPVNSTVTDPGGLYQFSTLPAGEYYLVFAPPAGYNFTAMDQGADDETDSDADPATGRTETISLGENESLANWDAGANVTAAVEPTEENATIGDYVWNDTNGNGLQDAGETGVPGVTVRLLDENGGPVTDAAGAAIETISAEDGSYALQGVVGTTYIVEVVPPEGLVFVTPDAGDDTLDSDVLAETGRTEPFVLTAEDLTRDAGINATVIEEGTGTVGGLVWNDTDGNGARESGEDGVSSVTVTLLDADGAEAGTTATDSAGNYRFTDLAAGTYAVSVSLPEGYTCTPAGTDSTIEPGTGATPQFELAPGEEQTEWNAGVVPPPAEETETPEEVENETPEEETEIPQEGDEAPDGQATDISEEETEVPVVE